MLSEGEDVFNGEGILPWGPGAVGREEEELGLGQHLLPGAEFRRPP
jgi:hypothetical protein